MTAQEAREAIEELRAQGNSDEEMAARFYAMFVDGDIDVNQLGDLCQLVGYELTEEFKNMSPEDQKTKGYEEVEDEDLTEEEIEDAKEITPAEKSDDKSDDKEESDDEKEARRLFGFDKKAE